jgi:diguanylate cyclase (GGDEF)-like protein/PAS domain S-box-containing protein
MSIATETHVKPKTELPRDVYLSLVDSLFGNFAAMLAGGICVAVAATLTAWKTQDPLLWACAAIVLVLGIARAIQMRRYEENKPKTAAAAKRWEFQYVVGAVAYCGMLGIWCLIGIGFNDDQTVHLLCAIVTVANVVAGASRVSGQPYIVLSTLLAACAPLALGLLLQNNPYYAAIGILISLFFLGLHRITAGLHETNLKAAIASHEISSLARRFDTALNNMPHGLCMCDGKGRITVANRRLTELLGVPRDLITPEITIRGLLQRCTVVGTLSERNAERVLTHLTHHISGSSDAEPTIETQGERAFEFTVEVMENGGTVVIVEDITERKTAEAKINHMARFDAVTGLPNRSFFHDQLENALRAARTLDSCAVLFIDLDQFKQVNDTLGHPVGDRLLTSVADRLRDIVRPTDTVARFGGDEFVVFRAGIANMDDAASLAARIVDELGRPYEIDHHQLIIGASIGIATNSREAITADHVMKNADMALYRAKSDGRGTWRFFEWEMAVKAESRRGLELDLRNTVAEEGFELHYQPLLNMKTRRISTCEALLRWRHPERGMISPAEFIPLAEEMGLIGTIGAWVLRQACIEATRWPADVRIAVNLSPVQFKRGSVVEDVLNALAESGLPASRLEIEITESVLLQDTPATSAVLMQLRDAGVSISLDDFGTGYSSLSYLHRFPLQKVKIDRSFLRTNGADRSNKLLHGIARLSADLGMSVVVEGIETDEQLALVLAEPAITEAQGFLFSRPVPKRDIRDLLAASTPYIRKVA